MTHVIFGDFRSDSPTQFKNAAQSLPRTVGLEPVQVVFGVISDSVDCFHY